MDLTVILVTYNSAAHLPACARALASALGPLAARIAVIDNASSDDSAACAAQLWPDATIIRNAVNRGFAAAVNQGCAVASGRAILLLNPDADPAPGSVPALLAHLDEHPATGIVAPRLLDAAGQPVLSCYPFLSLGTVAWRHLRFSHLLPDCLGGRYRAATLAASAAQPVPVDWAQGACLLLRRAMLDQIGLFDERFVLYCDEVDLCRRAALAGWQTDYLPATTVAHREGSSAQQVVPLKLASHYYSKVLYFHKHASRPVALAARALLLLDLGLRTAHRTGDLLAGHPPDAALRLRTYLAIARALLTDPPERLQRRWQAQAARTHPTGL